MTSHCPHIVLFPFASHSIFSSLHAIYIFFFISHSLKAGLEQVNVPAVCSPQPAVHMCARPEELGVGFGEGGKGEMTSLGQIHFSPPPPPLACVWKYVYVRRLPLPPYNVDEQSQSVRVISKTLNQGWGGRGDNKDVHAVETKKSVKKFIKRRVLITRLARIEASVKILAKLTKP